MFFFVVYYVNHFLKANYIYYVECRGIIWFIINISVKIAESDYIRFARSPNQNVLKSSNTSLSLGVSSKEEKLKTL